MTPHDVFKDYIETWEGGLSLDPDDAGNWYARKGRKPELVGSNHGVTAAALAAWRGSDAIAAADIAALTIDDAAQIAAALYYDQPGFDLLPWDPVVASIVDFGWGAGPVQATKLLQRMIGVADDGRIGPITIRAYRQFVASHGLERAAKQWQAARDIYYRLVVNVRPIMAKYRRGWMLRSAYFIPGTPWWLRFTTTMDTREAVAA
jgi:lysozyme family protein